jgi:TPR repeat protein
MRICKYSIALLLSLTVLTMAQAQSTIAKLKYEQAEEAFIKNDFQEALIKLDDVQKVLGEVNPKILYLRIMAQAKLLDKDTSYLADLKKNCDYYLKNYDGNTSLEEKFKEVFLVSERLVQYEPNQDFIDATQYYKNKNLQEMINSLQKAAMSGYGKAMNSLGVIYENGTGWSKTLKKRAIGTSELLTKEIWMASII